MFKHWKLALVASSLLIGGVAMAQPNTDKPDQDSQQHRDKDGGWRKRGDKRVGKGNDADRAKRHAEMLAKYDTNKDGKLDEAERTKMQTEKAAAKFAELDKNHDGVLSLDEAQPLLRHGGMQKRR